MEEINTAVTMWQALNDAVIRGSVLADSPLVVGVRVLLFKNLSELKTDAQSLRN